MIPGRCTMEQSNLKEVEEWMECFANQWHWCSTKEEIKLAILWAASGRVCAFFGGDF
ncbi:hypothetical protein [Pasteuria penetrans]|uniref:hypothetical protein n=1 Tax=Pasteuria penetrans TaxID=86005 RepID=UPI000FA0D176|nr:hypothetical protein [Pasteuria penetrans]